ncbi:hypothetical protein PROFUN_12303, partial [Planoprotostelium fungivorum]
PLLSDVQSSSTELTEFEIEKLLAIERGDLITIYIQKFTGESYSLTVSANHSLQDIHKKIKEKTIEREKDDIGNRNLSWKFVWKKYCLMLGRTGERMTEIFRDDHVSTSSRLYLSVCLCDRNTKAVGKTDTRFLKCYEILIPGTTAILSSPSRAIRDTVEGERS